MDFRIKPFLISFILVFAVMTLLNLGIKPATLKRIVSPEPKKISVLEQITPKLDKYSNDFEIKTPRSFISEAQAAGDFDQASAYGVIDLDSGQVLSAKELSSKMSIASITKVMTAVVALDLASPEEKFSVSQHASSIEPTKIMLKPGESVSLQILLESLLLSSANDSAQVIKEGIEQKYGEEVFIEAMNKKAQLIGLENSHFTNPQGFDNPNHYSSVEDVLKISQYALVNYPIINEIVKKDLLDYTSQMDERFYFRNWNGLIGTYPGTYGVKIGNTDEAGYTTSVVSEREGRRVMVVILGTPGVLERDLWAAQLLDSGFDKLGIEGANITEEQLLGKYNSWKR